MERQFVEGMQEISGFGGSYEEACRKMVLAGLNWWDEHPEAEPKFKSNSNIYGILLEDNEDAKALSDAVVAAVDGDCTGAMHQATISHILWIHGHSWEEYVQEMSKPEDE